MNDHDMNPDMELLKEKFAAAGKTNLPPSLTSQALFARMDAGEWKLPEDSAPAAAPGRVLHGPWRRWGTLAAALLVVVSLYAAGRSGLLNNNGLTAAKSADSAAPEAAEVPMMDGNYFCAGAPEEEAVGSILPGEPPKDTVTGGSADKKNSIDFALTEEGAAAAKTVLSRQSWEPRGGTEAAAYLFIVEGSEYGFDPDAYLLVDYTGDRMAFLSEEDCEALRALCP